MHWRNTSTSYYKESSQTKNLPRRAKKERNVQPMVVVEKKKKKKKIQISKKKNCQ